MLKTPKFNMPPAYIGQTVIWKPNPKHQDGLAAIVTNVGNDVVALAVFHPGMVQHMSYDGVRHESDPKYETSANFEAGVWAYVEEQEDYQMWYSLQGAAFEQAMGPV